MFTCFLTILTIDFLILLFHQGSDSFLFLLPQALRSNYFPTYTITAFIKIFVSVIFSVLICFNIRFIFLDHSPRTHLSSTNPISSILLLSFIKYNTMYHGLPLFSKFSVSTWVASFLCIFSSSFFHKTVHRYCHYCLLLYLFLFEIPSF